MRAINVSTEVFAAIWAARGTGEESENDILGRILGCKVDQEASNPPSPADPLAPPTGVQDRRNGVHFPEGFRIYRNYLGCDYSAIAISGFWRLDKDNQAHKSLNDLSCALGATSENAWINWYFDGPDGNRRQVSEMRNPKNIARRFRAKDSGKIDKPKRTEGIPGSLGSRNGNSDKVTWHDDVRLALKDLGGKASLHEIYKRVKTIRRESGRSLPATLEAVIRRTLEDHSADSDNYRGGQDIFQMPEGKGAGVWALKEPG